MEEDTTLKEVTNLVRDLALRGEGKSVEGVRVQDENILSMSEKEINFHYCLPGSIHEHILTITLHRVPEKPTVLSLCVVCQDKVLNDLPQLVFGIRQQAQSDYYDDYKVKVKKAGAYDFIIGVKTPMLYFCEVNCKMIVQFGEGEPIVVKLKQISQLPEIVCPKQLQTDESRLIKLGVVQGKSKKQCRVPFKLNHDMKISILVELIGLEQEYKPVLDVKPKSMSLTGKGQFSIMICTNITDAMKDHFQKSSKSYTVRRILVLKVKDTKFIYHFPVEVSYYPESKAVTSVD